MKRKNSVYLIITFVLFFSGVKTFAQETEDPYLWLEDIYAETSLNWVETKNEQTLGELENTDNFGAFFESANYLLNAKDRIPYANIRRGYAYNFWQDDEHVRGIWRRTLVYRYYNDDPEWEVILDLDHLSNIEGENWVFKGADCLPPFFNRCLLSLSRGGMDAHVVREFDIRTQHYVGGGFHLEQAKQWVAWFNYFTLIVGTDFGEGSLTTSGYPRIIKTWQRDTPLEDAITLLEGEETDMGLFPELYARVDEAYVIIRRYLSFFQYEQYLLNNDGSVKKLALPLDARIVGLFKGQFLIHLKSDWTVGEGEDAQSYSQGTLLAVKIAELRRDQYRIQEIMVPNDHMSIDEVMTSEDTVVIQVLDHVIGRIHLARYDETAQTWSTELVELPDNGRVRIRSAHNYSERVLVEYENFLTPPSLYIFTGERSTPSRIKWLQPRFDDSNLVVEQREATSADGTQIPYFIVYQKDIELDGNNPTLLYGYGGFEISMLPRYSTTLGNLWLEEGGVYVLSNIRGGGEFGPRWHQAALLENRQRAFDDFIAIAESLIEQKITSPRRLGIMGGSNGGLLMGATFTQRPDLFNAVVCQVPLLDMLRYHRLLAGASWMGEYGNPEDPVMRSIIEQYSPYQNVKPDVDYPEVFFLTSTRDDRVHPGHARKMAAKMSDMGHKVYYYENVEGGHSASANLRQRAHRIALEYSYLHMKLFE